MLTFLFVFALINVLQTKDLKAPRQNVNNVKSINNVGVLDGLTSPMYLMVAKSLSPTRIRAPTSKSLTSTRLFMRLQQCEQRPTILKICIVFCACFFFCPCTLCATKITRPFLELSSRFSAEICLIRFVRTYSFVLNRSI